MSTITKERIELFIKNPLENGLTRGEQMELARIALASLEAEAVAYMHHSGQVVTREECCDDKIFAICCKVETPLYAAPQLPQPVVAITQHFDTIALDTAKMVMCDVNRRDEFFGGDIQLLSRIQCRIDEACRAAMLQGSGSALTNEDTKRVGELVMWVKRLAHSLRKSNPDSKLQSDAMDYLSRKGLIGVKDILR